MLGYAKFMKDLVTKKISITFEDDRMQHCSAIATRSLVQNKEDPCAFTIHCTIVLLHFAKVLCDLGGKHKSHSSLDLQEVGFGWSKALCDAATDG